MLHIYIDADACPVKPEIYRVAARYQLEVTVVANARMGVPDDPRVRLEVVGGGSDEADDWIAGHAAEDDIVVTADVPLAARCLKNGALVLGPTGRPFSDESIGDALASRELMSQLRQMGAATGGPPPLQRQDRSRFLQKLDEMVQAVRRRAGSA